MIYALIFVLLLNWFKSILVGSDFNFYHWYKYGKEYTDWYFFRPEFKPKKEIKY